MQYTLDEMIGQMILIGFQGPTAADGTSIARCIRKHAPVGVWLTDKNSPLGDIRSNIESPDQLRKLISDLQGLSSIPLFVSIDAEGGQVIRLKEMHGFPPTRSAREIGSADDLQLTYDHSLQIARTLKSVGINFNFAPVVDLELNSDNPALSQKGRCYSADPEVTLKHASEVIRAHHEEGLLCCIKHFPGHGSTGKDSHVEFVDVTDSWTRDELFPFARLIEQQAADAVLTAHTFNRNLDAEHPATLSRATVTGLLREQLAFDGLVISDDLDMGAIQRYYDYEKVVELTIDAGVDVLLISNIDDGKEVVGKTIAIIRKLIQEGAISEKRIEESFQRIMNLKCKIERG